MKNLLAILALTLLAAHAAAAPATAESVDRLLVLARTEAMNDSMFAAMEPLMRQSMQQALGDKPPTPEQKSAIDQLPGRFAALLREEFSWSTMKSQYASIYLEAFDQEEVDGLLAFYASPAGQATLDKMPVVVQKSMAMAQERMQSFLPRMQRLIQQSVDEAKAANK